MKWTSASPLEIGYYWWKRYATDTNYSLIYVSQSDGGGFIVTFPFSLLEIPAESLNGFWLKIKEPSKKTIDFCLS